MEEQDGTLVEPQIAHGSAWTRLDGHYSQPPASPEALRPVDNPVAQELMRLRRQVARLQADNERLQREKDAVDGRFRQALELGRELAEQRNTFIEKLADSESARRGLQRNVQEARLELATTMTLARRDRAVIARANRDNLQAREQLLAVQAVVGRAPVGESADTLRERIFEIIDGTAGRATTRRSMASVQGDEPF